MERYASRFRRTAFGLTLVALALTSAYTSAWAFPTFTFTPSAVGLNGSAVTADNALLSNFSNLTYTGLTTFTQSGFLSITGLQLGGSNVTAGGLNSTYSLYFQFEGTGHLTTGTALTDKQSAVTAGVFDTLSYTLVGAAGNATFGFNGLNPFVTPGGPIQALAFGTLLNGNIETMPANGGTAFAPSVDGTVTFITASGKQGFFSPSPFYDTAFIEFADGGTPGVPFGSGGINSGFLISNGGGNQNFVTRASVPESATLVLLGLAFSGLVFVRRRPARIVRSGGDRAADSRRPLT